jgi:flagellar biosynthesis/type III secretory pathway M-ring protein FliF/YscJ
MKDRFLELLELFKTARPATRLTLVVSTLAVLAVATASSWLASRPDLVQLWSGLSSAEAAEYKSALAQAGIPFRSSPPPENGIWVDSTQRSLAEAQVALAGYRPSAKGIQVTDGGIDSAFMSSRSRDQMADKREWQECEVQLEHLSFVERATVCSSGGDNSLFGGAKDPTVATLVRTRFNVPLANITIVDERGSLLHDGSDANRSAPSGDLFAQKRRYDADAELRANRALEQALGKGLAQVIVNSVWVYDDFETIKESVLPDESAVLFESTAETKNPTGKTFSGGAAGLSSNIKQDYGNEAAAPGLASGDSAGPSSKNEEKRSVVGRSTEHRTTKTPRITRLSVALVADESVAGNLKSLEGMVKAAVGFDTTRNDYFESYATKLASVMRDEKGLPVPPKEPEPLAAPNEYLQLAIEHGVELLAALAFIIVLFKSLRGAKSARGTAAATTVRGSGSGRAGGHAGLDEQDDGLDDLDPELLARVQVEQLVRSDPERVSEILAQWASTSFEKAGTGR